MSSRSERFSGDLHSKRKKELIHIAEEMQLEVLAVAKFDLEEAIRTALRGSSTLRNDKRYAGLWKSMQENSSDFSSDSSEEEAEEEEDSSPPATRQGRGTPRRSTSAAHITSTAQKAVEKVEEVVQQAQELAVASPAAVRRITRSTSQLGLVVRKSTTNLREAAVSARDGTVNVVADVQETLSNAWSLTTVLVAAELVYVAYAAVPWKRVTLGPHDWLTRSPTSAFTVAYPDLSILYHPTFTSSFLRWSFWTILIPLIASVLLAFPGRSSGRRPSKRSIAPPHALSFALARLALSILVGYIFHQPIKTQWTFYAVEGFPAIQVLSSALSAAFAALDN